MTRTETVYGVRVGHVANDLVRAVRPLLAEGDGRDLAQSAGTSSGLVCGVLADWLDERGDFPACTRAIRLCHTDGLRPLLTPTNNARTRWAWCWLKAGTRREPARTLLRGSVGPAATIPADLFRFWDKPRAGMIRSADWLTAVCRLGVLLDRADASPAKPARKRKESP